MKKLYSIFLMLSVVLWSGAELLRATGAAYSSPAMMLITGLAPNIGAVWFIAGIVPTVYPILRKKEFPAKWLVPLHAVILALMLFSEIAHTWYSDAKFDGLDLAASAAASIIMLIFVVVSKPKEQAAPPENKT